MKKILTTILEIILVLIILVLNNPNLNYFKLKSIEEKALKYIHNNYSTSESDEASVHRERGSEYYVVNYSDNYGSYLLAYDKQGNISFWNEYLEEKIESIIVDKRHVEFYGDINVFAENRMYDKDRTNHLVLDGADRDTIIGSIIIYGTETTTETPTETTFARTVKNIYDKLNYKQLPIDKWKFTFLKTVGCTYRISCPDNMNELSVSDIEELIVKEHSSE